MLTYPWKLSKEMNTMGDWMEEGAKRRIALIMDTFVSYRPPGHPLFPLPQLWKALLSSKMAGIKAMILSQQHWRNVFPSPSFMTCCMRVPTFAMVVTIRKQQKPCHCMIASAFGDTVDPNC